MGPGSELLQSIPLQQMKIGVRHFYPFGFLIRFLASVLHGMTGGAISGTAMKATDVFRRFLM
jgi:hypothetical protein